MRPRRPSLCLEICSMDSRSEGFPWTGCLVPARGTPGVLPNGESSWDVAAAAVIWKMPKYEEMCTFSQMGMSKKSRNANFWKKSRRRPNVEQSYLEKATHALDEFILFYRNLKKSLFLKKLDFDWNYKVEIKKTMKPKIVPMVHTNILYSLDWRICDSKS